MVLDWQVPSAYTLMGRKDGINRDGGRQRKREEEVIDLVIGQNRKRTVRR